MNNIFLVTLAILVGLLWSGVIDNEMKWTATMFGLSLMAVLTNAATTGSNAAKRRRRE